MNLPSLSWTSLTRHNRQMARGLMLVATLWFGWRAASALWLVTGQDHADLPKPQPSAMAAPSGPDVDTARLAGFSLFRAAAPTAAVGADAPDTALQLRLDGVFAGSDPARSGAIISDPAQGSGKLYAVGQSLPGGATLREVHADRVILDRNGRGEVLRFVRTSLLGGDAPAGPTPGSADKGAQARDALSNAINRLGSEPDAYLAEMGLSRSGEGYEITAGAPANIRRGVGLKPGDRLLRLNGQPLGNPQRDRELLEQVQQSGHARVDIRRGSQTLTIEQNF